MSGNITGKITDSRYAQLRAGLQIDCKNCSGLCCTALYCMKTDGFPENKEAGIPCSHLQPDFQCDIHSVLADKNMRGCMSYDCFGAGQKVTRACYGGTSWKSAPHKADEIYQVFLVMCQLCQMEWYLLEALSLTPDEPLKSETEALILENEEITSQNPGEILGFEIENYRAKVNRILKQVCSRICTNSFQKSGRKDYLGKNFKHGCLDCMDFSMALIIAADLEGCSLKNTSFLGADIRDANIRNTDLSASLFLTQMQINSAKGNGKTKLPFYLVRPISWDK